MRAALWTNQMGYIIVIAWGQGFMAVNQFKLFLVRAEGVITIEHGKSSVLSVWSVSSTYIPLSAPLKVWLPML